MKHVESYLNEYEFEGSYRSEVDPNVRSIRDFFQNEKRITVVELVDKYQVMVYDGKKIHSSVCNTEFEIIEYLKGIL
jgi:hypothetical protein